MWRESSLPSIRSSPAPSTSLQQGWAVRTAAGPPGTAAHWQCGGLQEQGTWPWWGKWSELCEVWKEKGPHPFSFFKKKKIQNSIDDQRFEGSVALQSFYLLLSYPPRADQGHLQCCCCWMFIWNH